jgi:hypothetical protein
MGMFTLNMLVPEMSMLIVYIAFGYLKCLLLMSRDPLQNGFLNVRLDCVGILLRWTKMGA